MMKIFFIAAFILFGCVFNIAQVPQYYNGKLVEERAIYTTALNDESSIKALVENCKRANIHIIVMLVKGFSGEIYFHSERFQDAISPEYKNFDPLAALIKEAHKNGIKVHAWFCDFTEGVNGPAMKSHPKWAMLNSEGKTVSESELLGGGKKYPVDWMDPSRRPGYADQWLLPMMMEVAKNYDVDGIHHDYIRYPGDVAPDDYSFDDYSLEHVPQYARLYYKAFKDSVFPITPTLPKLIANWWSDPTVLPKGWFQWDRKQKAEFLLNGSFIPGGHSDMDYFFYTYRTDAITQFVKDVWEKVHSIKPDIEISASVFKNPVESGRFIGQRWTDFAPWVDIMMPMVYRSHFPKTDFNTFLKMFGEYVRQEYSWAKDKTNLAIGIAIPYIYNEERLSPINAINEIDSLKNSSSKQHNYLISEINSNYKNIQNNLEKIAPGLHNKFTKVLNNFNGESENDIKILKELFNILNSNPPDGYYPKEKLRRVIDTIRSAGGNGIAIYYAGGLSAEKLWPVLYDEFKEPSVEPLLINSGGQLNVTRLRNLVDENNHFKKLSTIAEIISAILLIIILLFVFKLSRISKKRMEEA